MNTELEKDSAPILEDILEKVDAVALDIDNTLLQTKVYYDSAIELVGLQIAEFVKSNESAITISKRYSEVLRDIFVQSNFKPILIQELCLLAYQECFKKDPTPYIQAMIEDVLFDFYAESPIPYDSTRRFFDIVISKGKKKVLHSHGQEDITKVKVDMIKSVVGEEIPYLATDISLKRDYVSWLKATAMIDTRMQNTLVVGDNFYADILPAIQAGCKNLIWIDRGDIGYPKDYVIPFDVEVTVVNDLSELL